MEGTAMCLIDVRHGRATCEFRKHRTIVDEDGASIYISTGTEAMALEPPLVCYQNEKHFAICTAKFQKPNKCKYFHLLPITSGKTTEQQILITAGI